MSNKKNYPKVVTKNSFSTVVHCKKDEDKFLSTDWDKEFSN